MFDGTYFTHLSLTRLLLNSYWRWSKQTLIGVFEKSKPKLVENCKKKKSIWILSLKLWENFNIMKKESNFGVVVAQDPPLKNSRFSKIVRQQAQALPKK